MIKYNKQIQAEVDKHYSRDVQVVADEVVTYSTFENDDYDKEDCFIIGVTILERLVQLRDKRRTSKLSPVAIYRATQEIESNDMSVIEPCDTFYFVGTPERILAKLRKLPLAEMR